MNRISHLETQRLFDGMLSRLRQGVPTCSTMDSSTAPTFYNHPYRAANQHSKPYSVGIVTRTAGRS